MARISGIDIPKEKRGVVSLTYIYGIGSSRAKMILDSANVSPDKKVSEWSDDDTAKIIEVWTTLDKEPKKSLIDN